MIFKWEQDIERISFLTPVTSTTIDSNRFNTNASEHVRLIHEPIDTVIFNNVPVAVNIL